jgi:sn-glycerol 3-phosphate transport system permease protein
VSAAQGRHDLMESRGFDRVLETCAAWLLGVLWILPLAFAIWTAFHPAEYQARFEPLAPLTLENFVRAWHAAPFARYFLNTTLLCAMILGVQLVLVTLAAYAFARFEFFGREVAFSLVLVQLMIMPDVLIVENYQTLRKLGLVDTLLGIGLPYMASAFGIFLLRQTFKTVPRELDEAARIDGCTEIGAFLRVVLPLAAPGLSAGAAYVAIVTWSDLVFARTLTSKPEDWLVTVGLQSFTGEYLVDWASLMAAATISVVPMLLLFVLVQPFLMRGMTQGSMAN